MGTARRLLRELPVKDNRCSREEAAAFLEKDIKRAFRKATPKGSITLLKKADIIIPEHLIACYQGPIEMPGKNRDREAEKQGIRDMRNCILPHQKTDDAQAEREASSTS